MSVLSSFLVAAMALAGGDDNELVIMTPHNTQIQEEFEAAFARHVGQPIKIRWIKQGTSELLQLLQARDRQSQGGSFDIDLFFGGGIDHELAAARGYLQSPQVGPEILQGLPEEIAGFRMYDEKRLSFAAAISTFGIFVNARAIDTQNLPMPTAWSDLADPLLYSWVILADPRKSASVHVCYEAVLQQYGWADGWPLLMQMAANSRVIADSSSGIPNEIAAGNAVAGPCVDFYAHARIDQAGGTILQFVVPPGSAVTPDPISMLRSPPHRDLAEKFVNFVLSSEGQQLWILSPGDPGGPQRFSLYRTSARADVYVRHGLTNPLESLSARDAVQFDSDLQRRRSKPLAELMGAALVDQHDDLKAAWDAVIRGGHRPNVVQEWRKPIITDQDLLEAASALDKGGKPHREVVRKWREAFAAKYKLVRKLAEE